MPNWCQINVTFFGDAEDVRELRKAVTVPVAEREPVDPFDNVGSALGSPVDGSIDLARVRPCPDDEFDQRRWCVDNWGTKWSPDVELVTDVIGEFSVAGQSAWAPPSELLRFISAVFHVSVVVFYREDGMCYGGADAYRDGEEVYDGYFQYDDVSLPDVDWDAEDWPEQHDRFSDALYREIESREDEAYRALAGVSA